MCFGPIFLAPRRVCLTKGDSEPRCVYHGRCRHRWHGEEQLVVDYRTVCHPGKQSLSGAFETIRPRLDLVERFIAEQVANGPQAVQEAGGYVLAGGGKRLRPALLLTVARMLGATGELDVAYAAVIEMVHTATLVHDDIIDHAAVRRGRVTASSRWGNQLGVLLGDWLYIRSMEIALELGQLPIMRVLSRATVEMVEGEILGLGLKGRSDVSRDQYLEIVRRKTAELFSAACSVPACFSPAAEPWRSALATYGRSLGICFQIVDDILDVTGSEEELGKPVFSDLREGKLTLPFITLLPHLSASQRRAVERVIRKGQFGDVSPDELRQWLEDSGAIGETRAVAESFGHRAVDALQPLPRSAEWESLAEAPQFVLHRAS